MNMLFFNGFDILNSLKEKNINVDSKRVSSFITFGDIECKVVKFKILLLFSLVLKI